MYTIVIISADGYAVERLMTYDGATHRFEQVNSRPTTTASAYYTPDGNQINAYANPNTFKR